MIYLDHNATSPLRPDVLDAMGPWLGRPANPASAHAAGQAARMAVEKAREDVAALVGGDPAGVVFTSGATEANHQFLRGAVADPGVVAVSAIEHPCVHGAVDHLVAAGWTAHRIAVDADGVVILDDVPADAALVSVMAANHETGALQPVPDGPGLVHVDAAQAAGRVPLELGRVHGVTLSSHKLGGPGGVGALVLRAGVELRPLWTGGGQERGRRPGTVNVAGVVGFAAACRQALAELPARAARMRQARDRLDAAVLALGGRVVGARAPRLPNTTTAVFPGLRGDTLVAALDLRGVCASSGAACASGSQQPSAVLTAMGDPEPAGALRLSVGPDPVDLDAAIAALVDAVGAARAAAALDL